MPSESRQSGTKRPASATGLLQRAAGLYGRGDLGGAEEACRQLLLLRPGQADALHVLGLVAWRRGERERALEQIRKAIASDPRKPQPHNSLGVMLKDLGDLAAAEAAFRAAVDLMPNYPEALTNLGNILCDTGRLADAEATHRRVVALSPQYADGHNNLATVLAKQERWDEAVEESRTVVRLDPTRVEFHVNFGNALSTAQRWNEAAAAYQRASDLAPSDAAAYAGLGLAHYKAGRAEMAATAFRIAARLQPKGSLIWANLGAAEAEAGHVDAALDACRNALQLDPNLPEAHVSYGTALMAQGKLTEAATACETAIWLRANYPKAHNNLGVVLRAQGRFAEALAEYAKAIDLDPCYAEAHSNKGMLHLLLGQFEAGWRGYEFGMQDKGGRGKLRYTSYTAWDGTSVSDKTLLVWSEQGVGDQVMFASLLPDLLERGARCVVEADARLEPLFCRSFSGLRFVPRNDEAASRIEQNDVDLQSSMGGACRWLRPNLESFPSRSGYLKADPVQVDRLRRRYREQFGDRPIVGISWRGGLGGRTYIRSIPLTAWSPILRHSGVGFVNLQYGDCRGDLEAVKNEIGVEVLHDGSVDPLEDLEGFAAQTAAMDLVISVDNTTVHMAGALNVPVWALLAVVPDWRWMLGRPDSPWYSSVRLLRQAKAGDWSPVIDTVAEQLRARFGKVSSPNLQAISVASMRHAD